MAWTTPKTWVTGDLLSATELNKVSANLTELRSSRSCRVTRTSAQSISDTTWTAVAFTTEDFDAPGWHSGSSANVTPDVAGIYLVTAGVEFAVNATGMRGVRIGINGVTTAANVRGQNLTTAYGTYSVVLNCTGMVQLNGTTDYINVGAFQSSGGALNTDTALGCWCSVVWIGA